MNSPLPVTLVGGAFLGKIQYSWPFARLAIGKNKIVLAATSEYVFTPDEGVKIIWDKHPLFGFYQGIRFNHKQPDAPERLVFLYWRSQKMKTLLEATDFCLNMD